MPSYNRNFGLRLGEGVGFFARADTELLSSGQAPVYQNLDLYAPICRPPLRGLVGRCRVRFAHAPGATMRLTGMLQFWIKKAITSCARSLLNLWFMAGLPDESANPFTSTR